MKITKKQILFAAICLAILSIPQYSGYPIAIQNCNQAHQEQSCSSLRNSALRIIEIENEGLGLTVVLENQGNIDIENIHIHIEPISQTYLLIPKKDYQISKISSNEQKNVNIFLFGFGIGLHSNFPQFLLEITALDIQPIKMELMANVIGPYVDIILEYLIDGTSYEGYTLFTPMWDTKSFLIANNGDIVHSWTSSIYSDAQISYLMENGNLIRTSLVASSSFMAGGYQGRVEIFDWNDTLVWQYEYSTNQYCAHHDITTLPNGNVLIIAWELKTFDEAINKGKNPEILQGSSFWPDHIIEVQPNGLNTGNIVWEWHAWDHIIQDFDPTKEHYGIISDHPELIDINFGGRRSDWLHINSVDYNEELDQILLSIHNFNEIWVIDHSTTTEEAAGHNGGRYGKGGDLLYRWGNPQAYGMGDRIDQKLFGQHDATWIPNEYPGGGNFLVFNNGAGSREQFRYSSIDEIEPPINMQGFYFYEEGFAYGPKNQTWIYIAENPSDVYSTTMSGAQRLPNGNTLLCSANAGYFSEVTADKKVVWNYYNPYPIGFFNKNVGKIRRYDPDYSGLRYLIE